MQPSWWVENPDHQIDRKSINNDMYVYPYTYRIHVRICHVSHSGKRHVLFHNALDYPNPSAEDYSDSSLGSPVVICTCSDSKDAPFLFQSPLARSQ